MGFGRVDARTLRPRPPLLVKDIAGRRQPVGWLAVGTDAVWTVAFEEQRLWRVPLAGGPARAVVRLAGFPYGLAAGAGAVWVLSGSGDPGTQRDRSGQLRRLDQRTGEVTATTPLPDLDVGQVNGPLGLALGDGAVWVAGPVRTRAGCTVAASCCGSIPPPGGWPGGFATRAGSSWMCWLPSRAGRGWPPRRPSSSTWSPRSAQLTLPCYSR